MSLTCDRYYTMKVSNPAPFTSYWPFEDGAAPFLDKVHGLRIDINPGMVIGAGLYGSALRHTNPINSTWFTLPFGADSPFLAYAPSTSKGISLCYWVNQTVSHDYRFLISLDSGAFVYYGLAHYWEGGSMKVIFIPPVGLSDSMSIVQAVGLGVWHFVCVTLNNATNEVLIYFDGVSIGSHVMTVVFPLITGGLFNNGSVNAGAEDFTIDEFGISMTTCLSQAAITWLYNAGAGRTWPAVSGPIPP